MRQKNQSTRCGASSMAAAHILSREPFFHLSLSLFPFNQELLGRERPTEPHANMFLIKFHIKFLLIIIFLQCSCSVIDKQLKNREKTLKPQKFLIVIFKKLFHCHLYSLNFYFFKINFNYNCNAQEWIMMMAMIIITVVVVVAAVKASN